MTHVFADAFYFIAILNRHDQYHKTVRTATEGNQYRMVTTNWVLVEFANALRERSLRGIAHHFVNSALADSAMQVEAGSHWLARGLALYGNRKDKDWSLTDCISFAVMEELGLTHALSADRHFAQAGFVPMLA